MKQKYVYPALFNYEEDGITVKFPDLPGCITYGKTEEDAFANAKEVLEGYIYYLEEDSDYIPQRTNLFDINKENNEIVTLIDVWMVPVRDKLKNRAIKKTLTIPKWLNDIAEERNVNFSQLLQGAIKEYLGVNQ